MNRSVYEQLKSRVNNKGREIPYVGQPIQYTNHRGPAGRRERTYYRTQRNVNNILRKYSQNNDREKLIARQAEEEARQAEQNRNESYETWKTRRTGSAAKRFAASNNSPSLKLPEVSTKSTGFFNKMKGFFGRAAPAAGGRRTRKHRSTKRRSRKNRR